MATKKVDAYALSQKFTDDYTTKIMKHAHFPFDAAAVTAMGIVITELVDTLINSGNDDDVCNAIASAKEFYNNTTK